MVDEDAKIVFALMNEIEMKEREISAYLPAYEFIYRIDYLDTLFNDATNEIKELMVFKTKFPKSSEVQSRIPKLQRSVFCFFLLIQVIAEQFDKDQALLDTLRTNIEVKSTLGAWKKVAVIHVACMCRNILAHVHPFQGENLNIHRTIQSTGDHEVWVDYSLGRRDWDTIRNRVNKERTDPTMKGEAIKLLDSFQAVNTNPGNPALEETHSLLPLIEKATKETNQLFHDLRHWFEKEYKTELSQRSALIKELEELHRKLDGVAPPL